MYYDLPLFGINVKVWKYLGFIEFTNLYRTTPILLFLPLIIIGQINFIRLTPEINRKIICLFMTAIVTNSYLRLVIVMKNQHKFIKFMKNTENWLKEPELTKYILPGCSFDKFSKRSALISKFSLIFGTLVAYLSCLKPFFLNYRTHPLEVYYLGFDAMKSPLYEIIFVVQLLVIPFLTCSYIPFTNLFISWLKFGINILKVLRQRFKELPGGHEKDQWKCLKLLIKFHKRIIRFAKTLEDLFSFVCLIELMLFTLMLCLLLLCILLEENVMFKIVYLSYIVIVSNLIFMSYWHSNEFSSESLKIADAVYDIDWTSSSVEISAGGMYPMTLEVFQALLNSGYTYFNVMRGFMRK